MSRVPFVFIFLLIGLFSCTQKKRFNPDEWYLKTRLAILKDASRRPDSSATNINIYDPNRVYYLLKRKAIRSYLKGSKDGNAVTFYSKDGLFELRREIAKNDTILFEGITYKKHFYGLSTWWYRNGEIRKQGIRWNDKEIGLWKTPMSDSKGSEVYLFRAGHDEKIDSLEYMKVD